jgi:hypothetical protein
MNRVLVLFLLSNLYFHSIGFAQGNIQEGPNENLKIEVLEKRIATEPATIIDYSIQMKDGQIGNVIENKTTRIPLKDSVYVIAKVKLTNTQKKVIKLCPAQELFVKNQQGGKCHIYLNTNVREPLTFQNYSVNYGLLNWFSYRLKQNESIVIDIIVELPENIEPLIIEYIE